MSKKPVLLCSACLLGEPCRYDGKSVPSKEVLALAPYAEFIPICPERDGGMNTPRLPSERCGERVINTAGEDNTTYFQKGAELAEQTGEAHGCRIAILKEKSPSCGTHFIYDGTFSRTLKEGEGICAERLRKAGFVLFCETELAKGLPQALKEYLKLS
ncbi:MAG: DUF523 domain-containing protein [Clostridia bacterium]|nr:DUF523 domain-containing protein [Clostridia bacterium]